MEVKAGEQVALYGASGSGKTTLLNLLAGLDQPTSGSIEIDGQRIDALGEKGRTQLRRQRLGFVFQFFNLLPTLTIQENIFLALELAGKPDDKAVPEILKEVGLTGKEGRYPHQLSGGEQQRVAIARALVKEPTLILADEPTGNLDSATGLQILDLLRFRCAERATTLLMATHSPLACNFVNRVLRIEDGVIREEISASRDERT
nr:ABC transporter ATP-binding protein [Deltaproteobacteria bacterium]